MRKDCSCPLAASSCQDYSEDILNPLKHELCKQISKEISAGGGLFTSQRNIQSNISLGINLIASTRAHFINITSLSSLSYAPEV